jgi:Lon protease-like protein
MPEFDVKTFSGRVRLFPLPNLVMFPHVLQPLHVFEPRYRELLSEAMAEDRLIAMAVLAPGWEPDYEGRPAVYPAACLGRVAAHTPLSDGRSNLVLAGLKRLRLVEELPADKPFREARAELRDDVYAAEASARQASPHGKLIGHIERLLAQSKKGKDELNQLLSGEQPLGMLTDLVAFGLRLSIAIKVQLLGETDVYRRAELLLTELSKFRSSSDWRTSDPTSFPPNFSPN